MTRYKSDPHWLIVKFRNRTCTRCGRTLTLGARAFYYPEDRSLFCDGEDCGKAASRDFTARAFDEDNNTSM